MRENKKTTLLGPGARRAAAAALLSVLALLFLPLLLLREEPLSPREGDSSSAAGEPEAELPLDRAVQPTGTRDRGRAVRLKLADGSVEEVPMSEYLWGVVAAEMPASFEEEALKAQACAARTYTVRKQASPSEKHPDADVCVDSACCQAYILRDAAEIRWGLNAGEYGEKITRAVAETDGLGILYAGEPIQAVFFSSAPGKTADAAEVWGNEVDYLKSVDSPEGDEVPNYRSRLLVSPEEVKTQAASACPGADLSGDPSGWFGKPETNGAGMVNAITLGGAELTGRQVRSMFSLRSAAFTVTWDGEQFVFDVTGYGHGVGMSQYGANALAKEGKTFRDILTWYYTGAAVGKLW